jgi:hypothetical protein
MKRYRTALYWFFAAIFLAGCAATAPTTEKREPISASPPPQEEQAPPPPKVEVAPMAELPRFEDRDLFSEGLILLNSPDRPDPAKAREVFVSLPQRYPQSPWRSAAESFVRLIDEGETCLEADRKDRLVMEKLRAEQAAARQEMENLKKAVRELTDKFQTETASLMQENEQLKKDLQQLKALEIELEKRDRMLR